MYIYHLKPTYPIALLYISKVHVVFIIYIIIENILFYILKV